MTDADTEPDQNPPPLPKRPASPNRRRPGEVLGDYELLDEIAVGSHNNRIELWDVERIQRRLKELGLGRTEPQPRD